LSEKPIKRSLLIGALALFPAREALSALITFDGSGVGEGVAVNNQFTGVSFSGAILALPGAPVVAFYGQNNNTTDNLDTAPGNPSFSGPFITDNIVGGDITISGTIEITFASAAKDVSFWIADIDGPPIETLSVQVFDLTGVQIGSTSITSGDPGTGDGIATFVPLSFTNIGKLNITVANATGHAGWGLDSLSFTTVPEPSSILCTLVLGGMSLSRLRRRR
jgi:hypothetical protein